jgi:hypothetical protein
VGNLVRDDKKQRAEYIPLVPEIKKWLGIQGINFFKDIKRKYGTLLAVWDEGGIPHCVHFREGMSVRNKLRELTDGNWSSNEYDNTWVDIIEECIL